MNFPPTIALTALLAGALFLLGRQLARRFAAARGRFVLIFVAAILGIPALLFASYYLHFFDNAAWFINFRAMNYSELVVSGIGFTAGVLYGLLKTDRMYGLVVVGCSALLFIIPFLKQVLDPLDYATLRTMCPAGVCLQSTASTCGPSSAAAILNRLGVTSSERGLAERARTLHGGTELWYLARAIREKGAKAELVIQRANEIHPPVPSVAGVVLPGGTGHFIAVLDHTEGQWELMDPLTRNLVVNDAKLAGRYHFTGTFLKINRKQPGN